MGSDLRSSGIDIIGNIPWGTHFCHFYHNRKDLVDVLVPYLKEGLENNEFCMWVTSEPLDEKEAKKAIRKAMPDLGLYLNKGQLEILPYDSWYLKDGILDLSRVPNNWADKLNQALSSGYDGIRVASDNTWLDKKNWRSFVEYEEEINRVIDGYQITFLCAYFLDTCGSLEVIDVVSNHRFALIRRESKWVVIASAEQLRVEEELKENEEKYRTLVKNISLGIFRSTPEPDGKFLEVNPAMERITGYSREELLQMNVPDLYRHPEERKRILEEITSATVMSGVELRFVKRDGTEITVYDTKVAVRNDAGQIMYFDGTLEDITERKQGEDRIIHLNSVLHALRGINQLITHGPNRERLIQQSCDLMVKTRGFLCAWILLFNEKKEYILAAVTGGKETQAFYQQLKQGNYPPCVDKILAQKDSLAICGDIVENGLDCLLRNTYRESRGLISRLEYEGKVYGIASVYIQSNYALDPEEQHLFRELSGDIAYALYSIEGEEKRKKAEEEIERLARFPSENPNPVLRVAHNGQVMYANRNSQSLLEHWKVKIGECVKEPLSELIKKAIRDNRVLETEVDLKGKVFSCFLAPISSAGYVNIYGMDITELKRAEETLRESEERYRTLFESAAEGILIADIEVKKFKYANPAICTMLGYSQEELKKMDVGDIHPKTSLEHVVADFDAQARGKKIFESGLPCLKKDGTIIYADIKAAKAIIDGIECNVGFFTDVTERKQAEEKLEIAEQNYRNSLDDSPLGIRIVTADGELLYANKAILDIYGYSSVEEFKAIPRKKLYTPESYSEHQQRKELRKAGKPVPSNYEISIVRKDGGIRQLSVLRKEVTWNGERQFQVIYQDVTEGKKMQEQLIVTDRLASIGELSAGIAHEINNPLTGVIGFSDLLSDRKDLPDDVKEDLKVINREARRTADVVRNLLTFARKHEVQKTPIDINKVIQNVLDLRAYEQKVNNIEVKTSLSPDLSEINADAFRLQQVFLNIVINAEFFMNEAHGRGTLTITTERIKNVIRASISDDGPGIAKVAINHLFDPFFTTKEVGKGTGLGLSICHGIITEHGGRIYAESELDKGATFVIELPIDIK